MKNTLETRLGIFFALAFVAAIIIIEMLGGLEFLKGGYPIRALFNTVHELKVGDPVKMAGVQIGTVERINLSGIKVEVTMKIERSAPVKTDSKATIKFQGLLGQNYVSISFGAPTAPNVESGAELVTTEQVDLSTLMAKLDSAASQVEGMTKTFSGENFSSLLGPFTDFLKENKGKLNDMLSNLQTVSEEIAKGQGTIGKLITTDTLYQTALNTVSNLNGTTSDIRSVADQAKLTISNINEGRGTIGRLATNPALYDEATNAMVNLRDILQKINRGNGTIAQLINTNDFYKNARLTLQKVDKATEGLEDQGPLSVLGIAANSLF
ncbi:MAG: MlaD family protein [Candidatus Omnitrophica bacterium]|nr:MlaD family protein [Candidatus Omnitrophota bacterium]